MTCAIAEVNTDEYAVNHEYDYNTFNKSDNCVL